MTHSKTLTTTVCFHLLFHSRTSTLFEVGTCNSYPAVHHDLRLVVRCNRVLPPRTDMLLAPHVVSPKQGINESRLNASAACETVCRKPHVVACTHGGVFALLVGGDQAGKRRRQSFCTTLHRNIHPSVSTTVLDNRSTFVLRMSVYEPRCT